MKYAISLLAIAITILIIASQTFSNSADYIYEDEPVLLGEEEEYIEPDKLISDRKLIRQQMKIEIVPLGTIPDDIDLDEWVHEIEYEIMSERCDDILETTHEIKKLVETNHGSASKK